MRKILITGGGGAIAQEIIKNNDFGNHTIYSPSKRDLDLTKFDQLENLFRNNYFDTVINCACSGGKRIEIDNSDIFYDNILMLNNLLHFRNKYNQLITFSSGAEYNRKLNINNVVEYENTTQPPNDFYGLSKRVKTEILNKNNYNGLNICNLRLFNCFGPMERSDRFISTCLFNYINKLPIEIFEDKYFDFFYSRDLSKIINYLISHKQNGYIELNCVYNEKLKLSDVANIINNLGNYRVPIIVKKTSDLNYTGNSNLLYDYIRDNIEFIGLRTGIRNIYNHLTNK